VLLLKSLHVAAAILWIGNFAVTGVWAIRAFLRRSPALFAFAAGEILFTDLVFTLVFGSAVVVTGLVLAQWENVAPLAAFWTRTALAIVAGSGIVWLFVLLPLEWAMKKRGLEAPATGRLFAIWNGVGWLLTLALLSVVYLMIAKPV
jgi:uncharacterized membrane protein